MIFGGHESAGDLKRSDARRAQKPSENSPSISQVLFGLFLFDSFSLLKIIFTETASTLTIFVDKNSLIDFAP